MAKPLSNELQIILNNLVSRVTNTKFISASQMNQFRKELDAGIKKLVDSRSQAENLKKEANAKQNAKANEFKARVCEAWCRKYLELGNTIRIRDVPVSRAFGSVLTLAEQSVVLVQITPTKNKQTGEIEMLVGDYCITTDYDKISKVWKDGQWVDIYNLASGKA